MSDNYNNDKTSEKVITAVALSYDKVSDPAPKIVASGKGNIAQKIIEIAKIHNIEIKKDKDLVSILELLDVGSVIPIEAYLTVAEILSYIYTANKSKSVL